MCSSRDWNYKKINKYFKINKIMNDWLIEWSKMGKWEVELFLFLGFFGYLFNMVDVIGFVF